MTEPNLLRRFAVHGVAEAASRAHILDGASFEDAALRFLEEQHPVADNDDAVTLHVQDCESGERQCFRIDPVTGETGPCG